MSSFSFNGERKSYIHIERGWKRPIWAPLRRNFLSVPSYPGARLLNTQTEMRVFSVPVGIIAPSGVDMKILSEDIASWLITDQPKELIFDTEPDRTYLAVVDEEFDADEFVEIGQGNLKFICPMPYKLGKTNTHKFTQEWSTETTSYFTNKGSVEAPALIEMTVKKPSTFLDVWFGEYPYNRDYFRIGYPLKTEQLPVERNQRLIWDEMTTTVGWSKVSSMEDGNPVGEMESDGYQFYCSNYGTGTGKGWNGAAVKKIYLMGQCKILLCRLMLHVKVNVSMRWVEWK